MKRFPFVIVTFYILILYGIHNGSLHAQEYVRKPIRNFIALDLLPFYYQFFDYDMQIRAELDYARQFKTLWFADAALDAGMYDEFGTFKSLNTSPPNSVSYIISQNNRITGFHFLPSCNYYLLHSKSKIGQGIYCGAILDINYYRNKQKKYNDLTREKTSDLIHHFSTGVGLSAGFKYFIGYHFFAEIRTSLFCNVVVYDSDNNPEPVNAYISQWASDNKRFWWLSNIKVGYAF